MAKVTWHGFAKADDPLFTEGFSVTSVPASNESDNTSPSNTGGETPDVSRNSKEAEPPRPIKKPRPQK